ncbi:MAG: LysM peptidoglycan-binding domain-containing protein [Lachnospiraceae bacterium]|nr:LysM peptidoglycan-binding domain-containing protein [Lachnospiraceae bacterium]
MAIYIVQQGDTLAGIAQKVSYPLENIAYDNQIPAPYNIAVGQAIWINNEVSIATRNADFSGYAYPFINSYVLEQTLPYLDDLDVFSYGFTARGDVVRPPVNDEQMTDAARRYGTRPILTLTPLDESGRFNNNLISSIVGSEAATDILIGQLLEIMNQKGFDGLDIDFEYILAKDRDLFTAFVEKCTLLMNQNGYTVSVALAPKTSANQVGLLYEGKDYAGLGEVANNVLLMTYEWGYTYGPPQAVSPINKMKEVIEYGISEIPSYKINMGMPNYGYDWPLPFQMGVTKARTIGNIEAVQIAIANNASILYDDIAQTPYFNYSDMYGSHQVWFDDCRSVLAKLNLINEYNLRGASYWQVMRLFRANWLVQQYLFFDE